MNLNSWRDLTEVIPVLLAVVLALAATILIAPAIHLPILLHILCDLGVFAAAWFVLYLVVSLEVALMLPVPTEMQLFHLMGFESKDSVVGPDRWERFWRGMLLTFFLSLVAATLAAMVANAHIHFSGFLRLICDLAVFAATWTILGLIGIVVLRNLFYEHLDANSPPIIVSQQPLTKPDTSGGQIDRELAGVRLGSPLDNLLVGYGWRELTGIAKAMFQSVLRDERLFMKDEGDNAVVAGAVLGKIYKVGLMTDGSEQNRYLEVFSSAYGKPSQPRTGWYQWEDENTRLEMHVNGPQLNIMLTDNGLLMAAARPH